MVPRTMTCSPFPAVEDTARRIRDWRGAGATDHFVQFYRTEDYLIECLAGYVATGLWAGETAVVIATPEHRVALEERLRVKGVDVIAGTLQRHYLALDAREMLSRFMENGRPDRSAFMKVMGDLVREVKASGRRLRAFGEMVALLWLEGNPNAAMELENLWNELGREEKFALFCAYPSMCAESKTDGPSLKHICHSHSCVISLTA